MTAGKGIACAVDVGSTSIKAAVYDTELQTRSRAVVPFPAIRAGECAEADASQMWEAFTSAVRQVVAESPRAPSALILSAQMAGLVLLDEQFRPLGRCILGVDRRGAELADACAEDPGAIQRTGCPPGAIYPAAKLAWLTEHDPDQLRAARYVGGIKEYLTYRLTGAWVTDPSSASTTALYDQVSGTWWDSAVYAAGITTAALPRVVDPREVIGTTTPTAQWAADLPAPVPVLAGLGDGPAASLACGAVGRERLCLSLGTTVVARLLTRCAVAPNGAVPFFAQHVSGSWRCVGLRLDQVADDAYRPVGAPHLRVALADLPALLAPLTGQYKVRELRPVGSRCADPELLADLADDWGLPVRLCDARDGTRGLAVLALADNADFGVLADRIPVTSELLPDRK